MMRTAWSDRRLVEYVIALGPEATLVCEETLIDGGEIPLLCVLLGERSGVDGNTFTVTAEELEGWDVGLDDLHSGPKDGASERDPLRALRERVDGRLVLLVALTCDAEARGLARVSRALRTETMALIGTRNRYAPAAERLAALEVLEEAMVFTHQTHWVAQPCWRPGSNPRVSLETALRWATRSRMEHLLQRTWESNRRYAERRARAAAKRAESGGTDDDDLWI